MKDIMKVSLKPHFNQETIMATKKKLNASEKKLVETITKQDQLVTMAVKDMESLLNENKSLRAQVNHLLALVNILTRH